MEPCTVVASAWRSIRKDDTTFIPINDANHDFVALNNIFHFIISHLTFSLKGNSKKVLFPEKKGKFVTK